MSLPEEQGDEGLQELLSSPTRTFFNYSLGSNPELEQKIRDGKVVVGRLRIYQQYNLGLSFVGSSLLPCDVIVNCTENRGQALHGDVVAVELLPEEEWPAGDVDTAADDSHGAVDGDDIALGAAEKCDKLSDGRVIKQRVRDTSKLSGKSLLERQWAEKLSAPSVHDWGGKKPAGVVVAVLARSHKMCFVARLLDTAQTTNGAVQSNRYYQFKSYDPLMPNFAVFGRDIPQLYHKDLHKKFFYLKLTTEKSGDFVWTARRFLTAKIVRLLGDVDCMKMNSFALCSAFDVSMNDFSADSYACVPEEFTVPDEEELKRMNRRDLRKKEFVCSIDPATARDLDDALSITKTNGGYRVGVHIADVSYFVPVGSPLDEEARERCTSVYLVEKVIPMLPRKLSEDYCSLNPGSDKFAFSCIFNLDHHGKVVSEWFGRSVIRNSCRLTYDQAQRIIDGDNDVFETLDYGGDVEDVKSLQVRVAQTIRTLFELASKMRASSLKRGRLTIGNAKIRFCFEDIKNPTVPLSFGIERQISANWLVEEFMLLANARTAEKIIEYMPEQALLRCHEPMNRKRASAMKEALSAVGLELHGNSSRSLQILLDEAAKTEYYDDICVLLKLSLQPAKYVVNDPNDRAVRGGHYALALPWYTHFTSPIRRYCDIIAHRQLLCVLEIESIVKQSSSNCHSLLPSAVDVDDLTNKEFFYSVSEIESITEAANVKKLNAFRVSEISLGLFFCQYLKSLLRKTMEDTKRENSQFAPRVQVVVVRVVEKNKIFSVYAKEIAQQVDISLKSKEQLFKGEWEETKEQKKNGDSIQNKKPNKKHESKTQTESKISGAKLHVNWGPHPETGEEIMEELSPLTRLTAVLTFKASKGYDELLMIIDPPWERAIDHIRLCNTLI